MPTHLPCPFTRCDFLPSQVKPVVIDLATRLTSGRAEAIPGSDTGEEYANIKVKLTALIAQNQPRIQKRIEEAIARSEAGDL